MKKLFVICFGLMLSSCQPSYAQTQEVCNVTVCNKIERFSLDLFSHVKDEMGEICFDAVLPKDNAIVGEELSSESRWYQGSFNPTKKSVTRVSSVNSCFKVVENDRKFK